jgi:hypothetical protein
MKYLKKRDNYLQNLHERRQFESYKKTQHLNEAFKNEITWGDSLLGKLVNWVVRKIGIGAKMTKMPFVISSLKEQFDNLIGEGSYYDLPEKQKTQISDIQISEVLKSLANAVEEEEKVGVLKQMTTDTTSQIESLSVEKESEEKKKEIIEKLKKFLEFLNQFEDSDGGKGDSESGDSKEGDSEKKSLSSYYPLIIKNLSSLSLVLLNYKKVKISNVPSQLSSLQVIAHELKGGETIEKLQLDKGINKFGLTLEEIIKSNQQALQPFITKAAQTKIPISKMTLPKGLKLNFGKPKKESFIFESERNQTSSGESHANQAFAKLRTSIQILESPKEKGIAVTNTFLNEILSKKNNDESKKVIVSLYKEILRYLIGDKKPTLNAPLDPLYKESIEIISDKNKNIIVAEKIARFCRRALQFDGKGLYGSYGDLSTPLKDFVESLKMLMKVEPSHLGSEKKQESILFKYARFVKLIKEADENEEGEESVSEKIKTYFNENLEIDDYLILEEEAKKIESEIEKGVQSPKFLVIRGMNPIIEIVRIFNRAYKIHTTSTIPVGTTDGKVKASTWSEYTAFGYSSGERSATEDGPYRNNKIFNMWEDAVMDVLSNTKYAPIFAAQTKIEDGSGNIKEGAGVALRQMMLDFLDGDELYKGEGGKSDGGVQKRALNKYFGEVADDFFDKNQDPTPTSYRGANGKSDLDEIEKIANEIKTSKLKFQSAKNLADSFKEKKFRGTIFAVTGKNNEGKIEILYFFIPSGQGSNYFLYVSKSMFNFQRILRQYEPSMTLDKGDLASMNLLEKTGSGPYPILQTVISADNLVNLTGGRLNKMEINSVYLQEGKTETNIISLKEIKIPSYLVKEGQSAGEMYLFKAIDSDKNTQSVKGIKSILPNITTLTTTKFGEKQDFSPVIKLS